MSHPCRSTIRLPTLLLQGPLGAQFLPAVFACRCSPI